MKKFFLRVIIGAIILLALPGCTNPTNGLDGTNGENAYVLGKSFYLSNTINGNPYYEGDTIFLYSSYFGDPTTLLAMDLHINNAYWKPLTLTTIRDLGGWDTVSGGYGPVPSISLTAPATTILNFSNSADLNVTFTPGTNVQGSRFRKRYVIDLQDGDGTGYSFEFAVEAVINS